MVTVNLFSKMAYSTVMFQITILLWVNLLAQITCQVEIGGLNEEDDIEETLPKIPTWGFEKKIKYAKSHGTDSGLEDSTSSGAANKFQDLADFVTIEALAISILVVALLASLLCNFHQRRDITKIAQVSKAVISELVKNSPYHHSSRGIIKLELNELSKTLFTIDEASLLGTGSFGKVFLGTISKEGYIQKVAVKVMNKFKHRDKYALTGLLNQARNLSYLGRHAHVMGLSGIYSAKLNCGSLFVFVELCELGSLLDYLRKANPRNRDSVQKWNEGRVSSDVTNGVWGSLDGRNGTELEETMVCDMYRWSMEIASAMEFITSKQIVHGDIRAKNVLLTSDKRAKLSGLALPRYLYDAETSTENDTESISWRHMAPEALQWHDYSEKSDAWAFGILLWEIYTLGNEPYAGLSWDGGFLQRLENGLRPPMPTYNTNNIHSVMRRCWNLDPEMRPNFIELGNILNMNSRGNYEMFVIHLPPIPNLITENEMTSV